MTSAADAVFTAGLSKTFRGWRSRRTALHQVTLRLRPGAALALLGPNGAGKTTFVKLIAGLLRPTSGLATVFGAPAGSRLARATLGYVPETGHAPLHLTAAQFLQLQADLHGLPRPQARRRAAELLDDVGLAAEANLRLQHFSRGMRQRASLAAALLHQPRLLILDEPTDGLDPQARRHLLDLLRHLHRHRGVTLLLNSHLLAEVQEVCTDVAILQHGSLLRTTPLDSLQANAPYHLTLLEATAPLAALLARPGIEVLAPAPTPGSLTLRIAARDQLDWVLSTAQRHAARVESLARHAPTLESLYLSETCTPHEARP